MFLASGGCELNVWFDLCILRLVLGCMFQHLVGCVFLTSGLTCLSDVWWLDVCFRRLVGREFLTSG